MIHHEVLGRLQDGMAQIGVVLGRTALDVGGAAGAYVPLIHRLGSQEVTLVEPAAEQVAQAVAAGVVPATRAFAGTLQAYVRRAPNSADTAFIFNLQPALTVDKSFSQAVGTTVRPGGWLVMSAAEPLTALQFTTLLEAEGQLVLRGSAPPTDGPRGGVGPNRYIQFWQNQDF